MNAGAARLVAALLKRMAAERVSRGLTLEELALRAGIDRSHVGLLEKGLRGPSLEVACSLAWALQTTLADLLVAVGEGSPGRDVTTPLAPGPPTDRRPALIALRKVNRLQEATALSGDMLLNAIAKTYATFDLIDAQLARSGSPALSDTVELEHFLPACSVCYAASHRAR